MINFPKHSNDCRWEGWKCTCEIWNSSNTNEVEKLIKLLKETNDIEIQKYVADALGNIGDKRAVEPLIKLLAEKKSEITFHAVAALGLIGDKRAIEPLIQALGYGVEETSIAYWLKGENAKITDWADNPQTTRSKLPTNPDIIARGLSDNVEDVRYHCVEILDELNWKPKTKEQRIDYLIAKIAKPEEGGLRYFRTPNEETRNEIIKMGEYAVPSLVNTLEIIGKEKTTIMMTIDFVAYILGKIGDLRAVEPLIKTLEKKSDKHTNHQNNIIQHATVRALGEIGDSRAVKPLIKILIKLTKEDDNYPNMAESLKKLSGVKTEFNRLELYDKAEEWYNYHGMLDEAADARRKKAEFGSVKVAQKVVHGDEVTEIKDSVLNKSNIGSGGDDKFTKLKELKEMLAEGLIDDDEFKQMKKEILGK